MSSQGWYARTIVALLGHLDVFFFLFLNKNNKKRKEPKVFFSLLTLRLGLDIALISCINNSQWKVLTRVVRRVCVCVVTKRPHEENVLHF